MSPQGHWHYSQTKQGELNHNERSTEKALDKSDHIDHSAAVRKEHKEQLKHAVVSQHSGIMRSGKGGTMYRAVGVTHSARSCKSLNVYFE
jgi:hypothetical protein